MKPRRSKRAFRSRRGLRHIGELLPELLSDLEDERDLKAPRSRTNKPVLSPELGGTREQATFAFCEPALSATTQS